MKANELMVDDWVLWKDKLVQVASVSGVKYSFGHIDVTLAHCNNDGILESHDIKSISPIPLTPEILEKNGFKRSEVFVEWKYEKDDVYILWKPFPWIDIEYGKCSIKFPCEYVHQLQHALKLCGIEKTIEL